MARGVESETNYAVVTTVVGQFDYRTFSQTVHLTVSQVVTATAAWLVYSVVAEVVPVVISGTMAETVAAMVRQMKTRVLA